MVSIISGSATWVAKRLSTCVMSRASGRPTNAVHTSVPPLPFLPPQVHGTGIIAFAACYAGPMDVAEVAMRPLREIGRPIADVIGPHPFVGWQAVLDPLLAPGARNYWKSHSFSTLSDGVIDTLVEFAGRFPSPECELVCAQLGGAVVRSTAQHPQKACKKSARHVG